MKIDAHQHFWKLSRGDYHWLTEALAPIYRDFLPDDIKPLLEACNIDGTVLVQAAATEAETHFMLELAAEHSFIKGVVGWTDFEHESAVATIEKLAAHSRLVGLRPMLQDIPDTDWIVNPQLDPAFRAMIDSKLTFDALVKPHHLGNLFQLLDRYPDLTVVIDHAAKPDIAGNSFEQWAADMKKIAENSTAWCKLSGLTTEAGTNWTVDSLRPYVAHLVGTFGPGRLIWGSDWPVCLLASNYSQWHAAAYSLIESLSADDVAAVMGENAIRAYRLKSVRN